MSKQRRWALDFTGGGFKIALQCFHHFTYAIWNYSRETTKNLDTKLSKQKSSEGYALRNSKSKSPNMFTEPYICYFKTTKGNHNYPKLHRYIETLFEVFCSSLSPSVIVNQIKVTFAYSTGILAEFGRNSSYRHSPHENLWFPISKNMFISNLVFVIKLVMAPKEWIQFNCKKFIEIPICQYFMRYSKVTIF